MKRRVFSAVTAVLVAIGLAVTVDASPAMAAYYCGSQCDGKNPQTYQWYINPVNYPNDYQICAWDAQTVREATAWDGYLAGYTVQLRYSPGCQTAWARIVDNGFGGIATVWVESYYQAWGGTLRRKELKISGTGWTKMVNDAGLYAQACVTQYWGDPAVPGIPPPTTVCTSRY